MPSPRPARPTRRVARALPLMLCAGLGFPVLAPAATPAPPPIDYAYDLSGQLKDLSGLVNISQDGSDVLFRHLPNTGVAGTELFARNRTTNTTTQLLPGGDEASSASANGQRVLFRTTRALDPADRNLAADFYVLDRKTGISTVVSRAPSGIAAGHTSDISNSAAISGDGNSVVYDWNDGLGPQVLRYVPATGVVSKVGDGDLEASNARLDTKGLTVVTGSGLVSHGTTYPLPFTKPPGYRHVSRNYSISPDGSAIAEERGAKDFRDIIITSAVDGSQQTLPRLPFEQGVHVLSVANGGTSVLVARISPDGTKDEVDRITPAGAITPVATLPLGGAYGPQGIASADSAFVGDRQLFKIGTSTGAGPVPNPIPPAKAYPPSAADAVRAVIFYPGCSSGGLFAPAIKPSVVLSTAATATNPRTPVSAAVVAIDWETGDIVSTLSLKAGGRGSLNVGWGRFTLSQSVTFSDGTKSTGLTRIDAYPPLPNDKNIFTGEKGICQRANGL